MDEEVQRFREALLGEIWADATAGGDYASTCFIDRACQVLEAGEEFTEYHICRAHGLTTKQSQIQIDAYSFSRSDGVLNLIVCAFSGQEEPERLLTDEVRRLVQSAYRFLEMSVYDSIGSVLDEGHPAHALAQEIYSFVTSDEMTKAAIHLISDRPLGTSIGRIPEVALGTKDVDIHIWDIARLARMEASSYGREEIEIDFVGEYGEGIAALPIGLEAERRYDSYMCVMPGSILAGLYDRFGGRILEQNVRAFLGDSRKVNKGIRETLRNDPGMFFAYNNGLTATVSDLALMKGENGGTEITKVKGLQVVNGGQTTASLFWARKAGIDISKAHVQMKLSRLPEDGFEDAVHNIARFANAQNAVSASDLFAGHPLFKRLELLSRRTLAPPTKAGEINSYWYFERTTGSYKVELKRLGVQAAKAWQLLNPKRQILSKTDVARYEVTFASMPHSVCQGAQKNIATFGRMISEVWNADPTAFDEAFFQRLVGRAILVRAVDSLIPAQRWYPGSIVRPLSSYTLALISSRMESAGLQLDYHAIWRAQKVPSVFIEEAMRIAEAVLPLLQEIPPDQVRNRLITEWVKREACWALVEKSEVDLSPAFKRTLSSRQPPGTRAVSWRFQAQSIWMAGGWKRLRDWNRDEEVLTPGEQELVEWAAVTSEFQPRGIRLTKLKEAWRRAAAEGFI
jgi:hypothetical protein